MGFIRVRQAEGPAHEFDIPEAAYARDKGAYVVVDKRPVASPRPAKYKTTPVVKAAAQSAEKKEK